MPSHTFPRMLCSPGLCPLIKQGFRCSIIHVHGFSLSWALRRSRTGRRTALYRRPGSSHTGLAGRSQGQCQMSNFEPESSTVAPSDAAHRLQPLRLDATLYISLRHNDATPGRHSGRRHREALLWAQEAAPWLGRNDGTVQVRQAPRIARKAAVLHPQAAAAPRGDACSLLGPHCQVGNLARRLKRYGSCGAWHIARKHC
mmetsp:Transcript_3541/g.10281  ORF Transcript_3541/g.10281 Transcript_3541/m.10281 type:complete len:200 (-) Transcript_3541:669-1268(-)